MLKKILLIIGCSLLAITLAILLGPRPQFEQVDNTPSPQRYALDALDEVIASRERSVPYLKPDNEARIIWADSIPHKTPYSIVYVHGFSASQGEGSPVHINLARRLGANLYLPRLSDHGIDTREAMSDLTPTKLVEDAKEAIAIGKSIGDKVIVIGCSTGGTLGIYLAANDPDIHALILLSPNIAINNVSAAMVTGPWGESLAYQMIGPYRVSPSKTPNPYWSDQYATRGIIALQALLDQTMGKEVFQRITCPVYCAYYYKNAEQQDPVVSVPAMLKFGKQISTPPDKVIFQAFPDVGNHVIASQYKTDGWLEVQEGIWQYLQEHIIK